MGAELENTRDSKPQGFGAKISACYKDTKFGRAMVRPTNRWAVVMLVVAVITGGLYVDGAPWEMAWMPNASVGALTVALTITLIERAIRREKENELKPRTDDVLGRIGFALRSVLNAIIIDYARHHLENFREIPADGMAMIEQWLADHETEDFDPPPGQRLNLASGTLEPPSPAPMLLIEGQQFSRRLEHHRGRDREIMSHALIRAIDDVAWYMGQAALMWDLSAAHDVPEAELDERNISRQTVVEGVQKFAEVAKVYPLVAAQLEIRESTRKGALVHSRQMRQLRNERANDNGADAREEN